ncbi:unnamed protein product [Ambrosiozyma monospora]|uniref:Unnamed protein product n=1 Tax=Ambrosiozyma monospora TaxID=43982 RepID=A0A9W6YRT1_AMBMO|nr:unnamed protein product [Ambrosiozyma monospora]
MGNTVVWQFMGVSSSVNNITSDCRGNNLDNDILVGESNNQSVLWSVVLVLGLSNQSLSGVVVGLTFSSSSEWSLVSRVVSRVLQNLVESHFNNVLLSKRLSLIFYKISNENIKVGRLSKQVN